MTLADIGVKEVTPEKMDIIANHTVQSDESIYNELKPVSAAAVKAALLAADAEGHRRKQKQDNERCLPSIKKKRLSPRISH